MSEVLISFGRIVFAICCERVGYPPYDLEPHVLDHFTLLSQGDTKGHDKQPFVACFYVVTGLTT